MRIGIKHLARSDLDFGSGYQVAAPAAADSLLLHRNENPWAPTGASDPLINRYPEKQPAALVARLAEIFGTDARELLLTRGADDGIDVLIRSFCRPGNDCIAQCSPTFSMYRFFARLHGVEVVDVCTDATTGFVIDFEELAAATDPRIYFICNPNNPTGSVTDPAAILNFAQQVQDRAIVVVDEAYIEFADVGSMIEEATRMPNLVVLRTLSKAWSLAGARLGIVISNQELIRYLWSTTSPYPLARPSIQSALQATTPAECQRSQERIAMIRNQRERLRQELQTLSYVRRVYPGEGNFLLVKVGGASAVLQGMCERGILLRDQSSQPGLADHIRITIGSEKETDLLIDALREWDQ